MPSGEQHPSRPFQVDATTAGAVPRCPNHGHARHDGQGLGEGMHPYPRIEVGFLLLGDDGAVKFLLPLGNAVGTVPVGQE